MANSLHQLTQDIQTRIRELAYVMWDSAGRHHGMAMEYWLAAEQEVLSTLQSAALAVLPTTKEAEADKAPSTILATAEPAAATPPAAKSSTGAKTAAPKSTPRRTSSRSKTPA